MNITISCGVSLIPAEQKRIDRLLSALQEKEIKQIREKISWLKCGDEWVKGQCGKAQWSKGRCPSTLTVKETQCIMAVCEGAVKYADTVALANQADRVVGMFQNAFKRALKPITKTVYLDIE